MSGFKDMVRRDRANVFLDLDVFAELHVIEGREIAVVTDEEYLAKQKTEGRLGLEDATGLFYARSEDLPPKIASGSSVNIDGRDCTVLDCREDMGVTTVTYTQNRRR